MIANYYINAPSLASATSVYVDAAMTVFAPNNFYQQDNISRELIDGVLQPQQTCPSCAYPCGDYPVNGGDAIGLYEINSNIGNGTGAVIIQITSPTVPNGFIVEYDSANYNNMSSPTYGLLAATSGETYIGKVADDCGIVANSPHTLDVSIYNGSTFDLSGNDEIVNVSSSQIRTTANNPNTCIMVIPKLSASPSTLQARVFTLCPSSDFTVEVSCPSLLQSFSAGAVQSSGLGACDNTSLTTRYVAHVNGTGGVLGLYDWVFSDAYGQNILPNGYYYALAAVPSSDDVFRVENGVVVEFLECLLLGYSVSKSSLSAGCQLNITNLRLQVTQGFIPKLDVYSPTTGSIPIIAGLYTATVSFTYAAITGGCCDQKLVLEYGGVEIGSVALPTPPVNGDYYSLAIPFTVSSTETLNAYISCV